MTHRSMQSKAIGVTSVAIYICAVASLIEGIFVLGADRERWSVVSVDLVSRYPYTWGGSLIVASILLFVANRFSKILRDSCLYISAVWNVLFGIAVMWHAFLDVQPHLPRVIGIPFFAIAILMVLFTQSPHVKNLEASAGLLEKKLKIEEGRII